MTDNIIIAHSADPDGIISHSLFERAFNPGVRAHYYVDYPDFIKSLENVANKEKNAHITIADISFNDNFMDEELFRTLKEKNESLTWIDHHDNTKKNRGFLERFCDGVIYSSNKCSAELVLSRYNTMLDPSYDAMLANIAHAHDFDNKKQVSWSVGNTLQQVISSGYDLDTLVGDLVTRDAWEDEYMLNSNYQAVAKQFRIKKNKAFQSLKESVEHVSFGDKKAIFAYSDPMLYMKEAPEFLRENYSIDYVVVAFEGKANVMVFGKGKSGTSAVNFCTSMGGGGRNHGGGFGLDHEVTKDTYQIDKEMIQGKLAEFLKTYGK